MTNVKIPLAILPISAQIPIMQNTLLGIIIKLFAVFCVAMIAVLVKTMPEPLPNSQLVFFRCLLAIPFVLAFAAYQNQFSFGKTIAVLKPQNYGLHIRRSTFGLISMFLIFTSVRLAPLPIANAMKELSPILITLLAALFLGEKIKLIRTTGLMLGVIGVALISYEAIVLELSKSTDKSTAYGAIAALGAAFTIALAQIQIRSMVGKEHPTAIVLFFFLMGCMVTLPLAPFHWAWPSAQGWLWLGLIGCAGGIGQLCITLAYRYADASTVAPFEYFSIPLTIVLGAGLFNEFPSRLAFIGIVFILAGGLIIIYREGQLARRERAKK